MSSNLRPVLPKPVFTSPGQLDAAANRGRASPGASTSGSQATSSSQMEALLQSTSLPEGLQKTYSQLQKEEHKKRLTELRTELDFIKATDWQFKTMDDLIGK